MTKSVSWKHDRKRHFAFKISTLFEFDPFLIRDQEDEELQEKHSYTVNSYWNPNVF